MQCVKQPDFGHLIATSHYLERQILGTIFSQEQSIRGHTLNTFCHLKHFPFIHQMFQLWGDLPTGQMNWQIKMAHAIFL